MISNTIFKSKAFKIKGVCIPEFELSIGTLVRIYTPNHYKNTHSSLGFDLTIELIKQFQKSKPNLPWAKNYRQNSVIKIFKPLTVKMFLVNKNHIDFYKANEIANEIGIKLNEKFELLNTTNKKALIIKATFEKSNFILLDYYGVSATGIEFLENIVNSEIEKGKSAIAFDKLEYALEKEPYDNIIPIKINA